MSEININARISSNKESLCFKSKVTGNIKPSLVALIISLVSYGIHKNKKKKSQQAIGCRMSKYRHNKKIAPRPYVNVLIKELVHLGIIKHYGEYEDTHWYEVTERYRSLFYKIEQEAKRISFEACSSLHSRYVDSSENLTLLFTYIFNLTSIVSYQFSSIQIKRNKTKGYKRKKTQQREIIEFKPSYRDLSKPQLSSYEERMQELVSQYGVPFIPEEDHGSVVNALLFEADVADLEELLCPEEEYRVKRIEETAFPW